MKIGLYCTAFIAFATFSGTAQACFFVGLKVPSELVQYLDPFYKTTKVYDSADQATQARVSEFQKDGAEIVRLGNERCKLLIDLYKNEKEQQNDKEYCDLVGSLDQNDKKKVEIFTKWGDSNAKAKITTQFDPQIKADKCKQ